MELIIEVADGKTLAKVKGRLDTTNASDFEQKMQPMLEGEHPDIVVDCSGLDYVSSSGLRLFLVLNKSVRARAGKLVLTNLNSAIKSVFDMTGFSSIFTIK